VGEEEDRPRGQGHHDHVKIVDVAGREGLHVLLAAAGRFLLGSLVALGAIREYRSADEELVAWDAGILDRTCEATLVAREH